MIKFYNGRMSGRMRLYTVIDNMVWLPSMNSEGPALTLRFNATPQQRGSDEALNVNSFITMSGQGTHYGKHFTAAELATAMPQLGKLFEFAVDDGNLFESTYTIVFGRTDLALSLDFRLTHISLKLVRPLNDNVTTLADYWIGENGCIVYPIWRMMALVARWQTLIASSRRWTNQVDINIIFDKAGAPCIKEGYF